MFDVCMPVYIGYDLIVLDRDVGPDWNQIDPTTGKYGTPIS